MTTPDGAVRQYDTPRSPSEIRVTDGNGDVTLYTSSALGLLQSVADSAGNTITYAYDSAGNRIRAVNGAGETVSFTYDSAQQPHRHHRRRQQPLVGDLHHRRSGTHHRPQQERLDADLRRQRQSRRRRPIRGASPSRPRAIPPGKFSRSPTPRATSAATSTTPMACSRASPTRSATSGPTTTTAPRAPSSKTDPTGVTLKATYTAGNRIAESDRGRHTDAVRLLRHPARQPQSSGALHGFQRQPGGLRLRCRRPTHRHHPAGRQDRRLPVRPPASPQQSLGLAGQFRDLQLRCGRMARQPQRLRRTRDHLSVRRRAQSPRHRQHRPRRHAGGGLPLQRGRQRQPHRGQRARTQHVRRHSRPVPSTYTFDAANRPISRSDGATYRYDARGNLTAIEGAGNVKLAYDCFGRLQSLVGRRGGLLQLRFHRPAHRPQRSPPGLRSFRRTAARGDGDRRFQRTHRMVRLRPRTALEGHRRRHAVLLPFRWRRQHRGALESHRRAW